MPIRFSALILLLISLSTLAEETSPKSEDIVIEHKSGVYVTKQELVNEVDYIAATRKLNEAPNRTVLESLAQQLLVTKLLSDEAVERKLDEARLTDYEISRSRNMVLANARLAEIENVEIDEAVVKQLGKEYYFAHEDEFSIPEQRLVSHILIRSDAKDEEKLQQAIKLLDELKEKPDQFTDMAKKYSEDKGTAEKGGSLGWATKDRFVKQFAEAVFEMEDVGTIVGPVKTNFGYHIIKLDDIKAGRLKPYSEVEKSAIEKAVAAFRAERREQYIVNLRASGDHSLNKELINQTIQELFKENESKSE